MGISLNMRRISTKIDEIFENKIDMSDLKKYDENHYKTRAIVGLCLMMFCNIDAQDACSHITDGFNDMGIDGIYIDSAQKTLFLIQSKWRSEGSGGISCEEMNTFVSGIERIIYDDFSGCNSKILSREDDIVQVLNDINYKIHAIFIHTGNQKISKYASRPMNRILKSINDDNNDILYFKEVYINDIYNFLASGQSENKIDIDDVVLKNWGYTQTPYAAYYGTISAKAIGEWYDLYGNLLFNKNIRYYKGDTDVNAGMKDVIRNNPENFYYYNNGIKVLCQSIRRKAINSTTNENGVFRIEGVSLVNGAQTAGIIGSLYKEDSDLLNNVNVMIQLIDLTDVSDETARLITRLSNTQNRIENKDFAALDPQQERLRQDILFSNYTYVYKTSNKGNVDSSYVYFDEAIVALACLDSDIMYSTMAKRNVGALSEDIEKVPYKRFFNSGTNAFHLINSVLCIRQIDNFLKNRRQQEVEKKRLICIHGNRFFAHFVLNRLRIYQDFSQSVLDISCIDECIKSEINELLPALNDIISTKYSDSYPANIFKTIAKCKEIKEILICRKNK